MKRSVFILLATSLLILPSLSYSQKSQGRKPGKESTASTKPGNGMKAVLIVGPQEDNTRKAIDGMIAIGKYLYEQGVKTYPFFDGKADWKEIVKAARDADFLIYSGHGTTAGTGDLPGGLVLSEPRILSPREMASELRLRPNAVVIFKSVCYGAGSSASDDEEISPGEAKKRVTSYARTFFDCGAGCYYANNLGGGALDFLRNFFAGKTARTCFLESAEEWCKVESTEPCAFGEGLETGIASSDWGGKATRIKYVNGKKTVEEVDSFKSYDVAYIARPDFRISDMVTKKP